MASSVDRLTIALADRYRIERELGVGGMAAVYLAQDLKHDREVAIKVLRAAVTEAIGGDRFVREIAITARLNHPNILPLLDSGETADGEFVYYVMPVATGESLHERVEREGALPLADALRLACELTEALVHAHGIGLVHRDIKPANVLLSSGHVLMADFGIAKAVGQANIGATLTREGMSLGSPVYMAPEQVSGSEEVDARADIYAIGAVLYEMLTGVPPFTGTIQQIFAAMLTKDAPSVAERCPSAPPALVRLVARCLERDAAERPASADELLAELRGVAKAPATPARGRSRQVAVIG